MDINDFNKPTESPMDTFGKAEIEDFMWWFLNECYEKKDLDAEIATKHDHDPLVDMGILHKVSEKKYKLTKSSKGKLYSFYGKD